MGTADTLTPIPPARGFHHPGNPPFQEQALRSQDKAFSSDLGPSVVARSSQGADIGEGAWASARQAGCQSKERRGQKCLGLVRGCRRATRHLWGYPEARRARPQPTGLLRDSELGAEQEGAFRAPAELQEALSCFFTPHWPGLSAPPGELCQGTRAVRKGQCESLRRSVPFSQHPSPPCTSQATSLTFFFLSIFFHKQGNSLSRP